MYDRSGIAVRYQLSKIKLLKFFKILTESVKLNRHFKISEVSTVLVLKNKQIICNFIRLMAKFDDEFSKNYLNYVSGESNLVSKTDVSSILRVL